MKINNRKIIQKVNLLLEGKSNAFKRKYFLLSLHSSTNVKRNKLLMSEAVCYINTLIKSNGQYPAEYHLTKFYKQSLKENNDKFIKEKLRFAKSYNDLINPKIKNNIESLISEEIQNISLYSCNAKTDTHLQNVLIKSIENSIPLMIESSDKEDEQFAEDRKKRAKELKSLLQKQEEMFFGSFEDMSTGLDLDNSEEDLSGFAEEEDLSGFVDEDEDSYGDVYDIDDDFVLSDESDQVQNIFRKSPKSISLKNLGYKSDVHDPNHPRKAKLKAIEKVGKDAVREMKGMSNIAKRKFDIIRQIHYYLNVQQKLDLIDIKSQDIKQDLSKDKKRFSYRASGLTEEEIESLKSSVDDILLRNSNFEPLNLDDDSIKESELMSILKKAAGRQTDELNEYKAYLNKVFPKDEKIKSRDPDDVYDSLEDYDQYLKDNEDFEEKQRDDDTSDFDASELDPVSGTPMHMSQEDAEKASIVSKQKQNIDDDSNTFTLEQIQSMSDDEYKKVPKDAIISIDVDGRSKKKRKAEVYDELYNASATPEEFASFVSSFIDTDKPMSYSDLARASSGRFKNAAGIRQDAIKQWFKALFFNVRQDIKAKIYSKLGEKWIEGIQQLDLVKDEAIKIAKLDYAGDAEAKKYFEKIVKVLKDPTAIEEYFNEGESTEESPDSKVVFSKNPVTNCMQKVFKLNQDDEEDVELALEAWDELLDKLDEDDLGDFGSALDAELNKKRKHLGIVDAIKSLLIEKRRDILKSLDFKDQVIDTGSQDANPVSNESNLEPQNIMEYLFNDITSFRIFATSLLREFYSKFVWSKCESILAYAVKEFFEKNYAGSKIGASLKQGQKSSKVVTDEGKDLFNPIIYWVMSRTGIKDKGQKVPIIEDAMAERKEYFKKKFPGKVDAFNSGKQTNKLNKHKSNPIRPEKYDDSDLDLILDDMANASGIIGGAYESMKVMSDDIYKEFEKWVGKMKPGDAKLLLAQSLLMQEAFSELEKGEIISPDVEGDIKSGATEDIKGAPHYLKLYKEMYKELLAKHDERLKSKT
jgi:hypothetical protein